MDEDDTVECMYVYVCVCVCEYLIFYTDVVLYVGIPC